jgi:hypothetical protein
MFNKWRSQLSSCLCGLGRGICAIANPLTVRNRSGRGEFCALGIFSTVRFRNQQLRPA